MSDQAAGGGDTPAAGGGEATTAGGPGEGGSVASVAGSGGDAGAGPRGDGGASGSDGEGGAGGSCDDPGPTNCCSPEDPPCVEDWALECYNDWGNPHYCCDATMGVRRRCTYDGDFYSYSDTVCLNPCTGRSYGTADCTECLMGLPECPAFGCTTGNACKNGEAGYALSCFAGRAVECVCDATL